MVLTHYQRRHLADKLMDTANVVLATLVLAGFVERRAQWPLVAGGLTVFVTLVVLTTKMRKGG